MLSNLQKYEILLASNSPRRRELLAGLDIEYSVTALPEVDESYPATLSGEEIPLYISQEKAAAYRNQMKENTLLITADTIVWLDGRVYGKPHDLDDAKAMLRALSGKTHTVITGVTLTSMQKQVSFAVSTEVDFAPLADDEIDYYVDRYRPLDKAGAYGVQEWIGYIGVTGLHGSYYNVMGLPIQRLYTELKKF
ncbi:Maf-like protein [Barnesiella viscericola]|uniref:Maf-like protein n=1 Tax=Barnesiella viscericola TaxID=397865 RepID=UPI0025A42F09|nr:Maf-like protein [Barnesiella viscericola]MDM8269204.1 Maf-like protein [Barnesiella viscericola]